MMKRICALLLALVMVALLPAFALAEELPNVMPPVVGGGTPPVVAEPGAPPEGFDLSGGQIVSLRAMPSVAPRETPYGDASFSALRQELSSIGQYCVWAREGLQYTLCLSIAWQYDALDPTLTDAAQTLTGTLLLPENVVLADGLASSVTLLVQVVPPVDNGTVLTRFDQPTRTDAAAFRLGTAPEEIKKWLSEAAVDSIIGYDAAGNACDLRADQWDLSQIDSQTPGKYNAVAAPNLEGYTVAEGVRVPGRVCAVSIQDPAKPQIDSCVFARGTLRFPWVLTEELASQLNAFAVWMKKDDGPWERVQNNVYAMSDGLQLSASGLIDGSGYTVQVDYPGGSTGMISFLYDDAPLLLDYAQGNRDGGGDGTDLPDVVQPGPSLPDSGSQNGNQSDLAGAEQEKTDPAPAVPPEEIPAVALPPKTETGTSPHGVPSARPERPTSAAQRPAASTAVPEPAVPAASAQPPAVPAVQSASPSASASPAAAAPERDTDTGVVLSGIRVRALVSLGQELTVQKGNVTVRISAQTLAGLHLADTDSFALKLTQPEAMTVCLAASVNGETIRSLPDTHLALRGVPSSADSVYCAADEGGTAARDVRCADGQVAFTVDAPGSYVVTAQSAQQERENSSGVLSLTAAALACPTFALVAGYRRRRQRA